MPYRRDTQHQEGSQLMSEILEKTTDFQNTNCPGLDWNLVGESCCYPVNIDDKNTVPSSQSYF